MVRQLGRVVVVVGLIAVGWLGFGSAQLRAQTTLTPGVGTLTDPFTFYYGVYLPNQQLQSLRSSPNDTINSAMVTRQYYNQTDRRGLYDPISPYADDSSDPLRPFANKGRERLARTQRFSQDPSNSDGQGPSLYFGRATQYFPGLKSGIGRNANVASTRRGTGSSRSTARAGGGAGVGTGGMGGGMGGGGMGGMGGGGMGGMGMY